MILKYKITQWLLAIVTLPMAQSSGVEGRLKAILHRNRRRNMMTRKTLMIAGAVAASVLLPLAALRPVARAAATHSVTKVNAARVNPRAIQLLTQMVDAYKDLHSYSGDEVAVGNPGLAMPYEMNLTFQRPGQIVADITHHDGDIPQRSHILLDGKALYLSSEGTPLQVSRVTKPRTNYTLWDDAFIAREDIKFPIIMDLLEQQYDMAKAITQARPGTTITLGAPGVVDGVPVDTILERTVSGGSVSTEMLQIGQADHLLRRVTEDSQAKYQNPSHISQTFLNVKANPTLAANTFIFTAPPGTVVTDEHVPGADADSAAVKLLTQMYAAYTALKSFSCDMNVSLHGPSYGQNGMTIATTPNISQATYAIQKPNHVFITRTSSEGTSQAICDGTTLYVTTTEPNGEDARFRKMDALSDRYLKLPLQADLGNVAYNLSNFGGLPSYGGEGQQLFVPQAILGWDVQPTDGNDWKLGPKSDVNGEPVDTVSLRENDSNDANYSVMILSISREDHLLRQVTQEYHDSDKPVEQEFDTFTNVQVNPTLSASLFVFTPTPGSQPVHLAADLTKLR
jgi:outer membrane lipoprotein-sorting protein